MGGRHYTPAEDEYIRIAAGSFPAKEIARRINRSRQATCERARVLGISLKVVGERHHLAKYPDAKVELARSLHDQRVPARSIQSQTGIPVKYIHRLVAFDARSAVRHP